MKRIATEIVEAEELAHRISQALNAVTALRTWHRMYTKYPAAGDEIDNLTFIEYCLEVELHMLRGLLNRHHVKPPF